MFEYDFWMVFLSFCVMLRFSDVGEHLWPRSYGIRRGQAEFSDLHNLRPSDANGNYFQTCSPVKFAYDDMVYETFLFVLLTS